MNICMMTNTYKPFIGGVEASVELFSDEYRKRGHNVLIVTPTYDGAPAHEPDVFRFPAIQNFNGSDFSVKLPVPGILKKTLDHFEPDIVHSHHPFLMGDTALRVAAHYATPLVFTFHTFFERYTHYVPGDSPALKRFVAALATGYANLCDHVIAPSESVARVLEHRGVKTRMSVVPTGVYLNRFSHGDGRRMRRLHGIPHDAFVIGFVSRLAPEKNIDFLCAATARYLSKNEKAHFLIVGKGPSKKRMCELFEQAGVRHRVHFTGALQGDDVADAYHAMHLFVFGSHTETQGIVLAEAMAAGVPVAAVDAPGVREVVHDNRNGKLIPNDDENHMADAIAWFQRRSHVEKTRYSHHAKETARAFSVDRCVESALSIYTTVMPRHRDSETHHNSFWNETLRRIHAEWELLSNATKATGAALRNHKS